MKIIMNLIVEEHEFSILLQEQCDIRYLLIFKH